MSTASTSIGEYTRWSVDGNASHPLGDAFNSGTPATVAIGATVSGERFQNATTAYNDLVSAATGLTDFSVEGTRQIQAAFVELDVPITKALDLDISDRQDRYSDFGTTNNAKIQVRYQPIDILTLRGTASTGFRAPTLYQLYQGPSLSASTSGNMGQGNPFCSPGHYTTEWSPATCMAQGIGLYGGNPHLTPETSQNFDFGFIVSPIPDMGITLDYYRILLKNTIGQIPANAIYGNPDNFSSLHRAGYEWSLRGHTPADDRRVRSVPSLHGVDLWIHNLQNSTIRAGSRPMGST